MTNGICITAHISVQFQLTYIASTINVSCTRQTLLNPFQESRPRLPVRSVTTAKQQRNIMAWAIYLVADALKLVHTLNRNIEEVYFSDSLEKELQKSIWLSDKKKARCVSILTAYGKGWQSWFCARNERPRIRKITRSFNNLKTFSECRIS